MIKTFLYLVLFILISSCTSTKAKISSITNKKIESNLFKNNFTGFILYNPKNKKVIYKNNSEKYFTPASNTKIFTLYASLKLLPKHSPILKYTVKDTITYIEGTGNPTLLHKHFKDTTTIGFLKAQKNIFLNLTNFTSKRYGDGWAWEDYDTYFSPERSGLPLYGNVLTAYKKDSLILTPKYFNHSVLHKPYPFKRDMVSNTFYVEQNIKDTIEIPFKISHTLIKDLLENELEKKVTISYVIPEQKKITLFGVATDTILKRMMYESDNFLAEQLLIMASSSLSDTLSTNKSIKHILDTELTDLKQKPRWVDGSGLSRYNLFTPESFVQVLDKMYLEIPRKKLLSLFPVGGVSGSLKNWYKGNTTPYIYAKSGTLGNNYNLSGYLITNSGKTLIFSFMNNHFIQKTSDIKIEIQKILEMIRDTY